ncbi:MAG: response regulator [Patescibacteria group bacterium]
MPKILHFDDDTFMTGMYKLKFESLVYDYITFEHPPQDLVAMVKREKPDLIIMDIVMPEMDGYRATELLKTDPATRDIPICGLSNMGQQQDVNKALSLGMAEYWVAAEYAPDDIIAMVKKRISNK